MNENLRKDKKREIQRKVNIVGENVLDGKWPAHVAESRYEELLVSIDITGYLTDEDKMEFKALVEEQIRNIPDKVAESKAKEWEKAKSRYQEKSIWGKAKHILKGEHPRRVEKSGRHDIGDLYR